MRAAKKKTAAETAIQNRVNVKRATFPEMLPCFAGFPCARRTVLRIRFKIRNRNVRTDNVNDTNAIVRSFETANGNSGMISYPFQMVPVPSRWEPEFRFFDYNRIRMVVP